MKTKHLFLMLCATLVMPLSALAQTGALGSSTNPFLISSLSDLQAFRAGINSGAMFTYWADPTHSVNAGGQGQYFKIADSAPWGMGNNTTLAVSASLKISWEPIGTDANPFKGSFDGNNKVVGFRSYSNTTYSYAGLFGYISTGSTVKNLTVLPYIEAASAVTTCGGVVAKAASTAVIENCQVMSAVEAGYSGMQMIRTQVVASCSNVGGIVGFATNGVRISDCKNYLPVSSTGSQVGGIVGYLYGRDSGAMGIAGGQKCYLYSCTNYGDLSGSSNVGGVTGMLVYSVQSVCENYGSVISSGSAVGGIVGYLTRSALLASSNNAGSVEGHASVGGIVGKAVDAESGYVLTTALNRSMVESCINLGMVTCTASSAPGEGVGGIVGTVPATTNPSRYSDNTRYGVDVCYNMDCGNVVQHIPSVSTVSTGGVVGYMSVGTLSYNLAVGEFAFWNESTGGAIGGIVATTVTMEKNYYQITSWFNNTYANYGVAGNTARSGVQQKSLTATLGRGLEYSFPLDEAWFFPQDLRYPTPSQHIYIDRAGYVAPSFLPLADAASVNIHVSNKTSVDYQQFQIYTPVGLNNIESKNSRLTITSRASSTAGNVFIATPTSPGRDTILIKDADGRVLRKMRIDINAPRPGIDVPLEISTLAQLRTLRDGVNSGVAFAWSSPSVTIPAGAEGYRFELMADIDLSTEMEERAPGINGWIPIGKSNATPFKGEFNGHSHMIKNMYEVAGSGTTTVLNQNGFFGVLSGARVEHLKVHALYVVMDYALEYLENVGAVAGKAMDGSVLQNCEAYGSVMGGRGVAGIVGYVYGTTNIYGCRNAAIIVGQSRTGGIVGRAESSATNSSRICTCINIGNVSVSGIAREGVQSVVGGIVGMASHATIEDVMNAGLVESKASIANTSTNLCGGIVGDASNCTVQRVLSVNRAKSPAAGFTKSMYIARQTNSTMTNCLGDYTMLGGAISSYTGASTYTTDYLLGSARRSQLLDENGECGWKFKEGRYPVPYSSRKNPNDTIIESIASLPIYLYNNDDVANVRHDFKITLNSGYTWKSSNTSVMQVVGDSVHISATSDSVVLSVSTTLPGVVLGSSVAKNYCMSVVEPIRVYTLLADGSICYSANNVNEPRNDLRKISESRYELVVDSVNLTVGNYNYRVVGNHDSEVYLYPINTPLVLNITEAGVYKLTFVYNPNAPLGTSKLSCKAEKYIIKYAVTFKDYDGSVLKVDSVLDGENAVAPAAPVREGYTFTGWDANFSSVTSNMTVTAQYTINKYLVTFVDYDGTVLRADSVAYGSAAVAPAVPVREGYTFTGWDTDFSKITGDLIVTATYQQEHSALNDEMADRKIEKRLVNGKVYIVVDERWYDSTGRLVAPQQ